MPWRAIQSNVPASVSLAQVSHLAERLFWRMLAVSDPWGRLPGSARKVRALCVPLLTVTDDEVAAALKELVEAERIFLYRIGGDWYAELTDFPRWQPADVLGRGGRRYKSGFPDPDSAEELRGARSSAEWRGATPAESESEREVPVPNGTSSASVPTSSMNGAVTVEQVRRIYDHWRQVRGKTDRRYDRMSPARAQKIRTRLGEFTEDELLRALDAVERDPWEERDRHDDLTVLFRNREQVDRWLELAADPAQMSPGERLRARMAERGVE